jgi:hypothetical protein
VLQVREGLYYNPYFPGGAIAMPRMLADGGVEYDDGTPSNSSQQAKVRHNHVCLSTSWQWQVAGGVMSRELLQSWLHLLPLSAYVRPA